MSYEELIKIKNKSSSRKNFAVNLVRLFFTGMIHQYIRIFMYMYFFLIEEERAKSNVRGRGDKVKLNEGIVRVKVFEMYPLGCGEGENHVSLP